MNELVGQVAAVAVADDELATAIAERFIIAGANVRRIILPEGGPANPEVQGIQKAIADLAAVEGRLDILVQSAHTKGSGPITGLDIQAWQTGLMRGISPVFAGTQAAGRVMRSQGSGAIVLLTSVDGFLASPGRSVTCCGAAAVMMLAKVLACEWAPSGVRVNALASTAWLEPPLRPEAVELTAVGVSPSRIPLGRSPMPSELAEATLYLASPQASFVTGEILRVDGGWAGYHLF